MKSIFELIYRHIEPSIKRQLVEELVKRGLSRVEVAKRLGVSPSLVSRYTRKQRGLHNFGVYGDVLEMINRLADRVISGEVVGVENIYTEVSRIVMYILAKKYACGIHYSLDRSINPAVCNICPTLFTGLKDALK